MTLERPLSIAFYAPMKSPNHPVPSGDRQMARLLMAALRRAGHTVTVVSELRSHGLSPDPSRWDDLRAAARRIADETATHWKRAGPPNLWFTYHNYYKAPDLIGPDMTRLFGLPYVIAESSHAERRAGAWGVWSALADAATRQADLHVCFTARDKAGLAGLVKPDRMLDLPPFIDTEAWPAPSPAQARKGPPAMVTVAMMRPGDKLRSYRFLANTLGLLLDTPWRLNIVGDGPARADVVAAFATLPADRIAFLGQLDGDAVRAAVDRADLMVWPGFGEAFGLALLEAQAQGRPVVALDTAGVSAVVNPGETGLLVATPEPAAFASTLRGLLECPEERRQLGAAAALWVDRDRSLAVAARTLDAALQDLVARKDHARAG